MTTPSSALLEVDGGSRGNPGPAAYGVVLRDADTGAVVAEDAATIGEATNNVAEYSGLVAGLRLARELAPGASLEVRLDSQLVVEQMSGRWKVKHAAMRALVAEARELAPAGTRYTWVPRAENTHADRLVNEALDGLREGMTMAGATEGTAGGAAGGGTDGDIGGDTDGAQAEAWVEETDSVIEEVQDPDSTLREKSGYRGWSHAGGPPTTLVLVRHGVTAHTVEKRFSGGLASANPGLSDEGRDQVRAAADWLAPIADAIDAVIASPVRRTRESAEIVAERLGREVELEPGFAEMEFGRWDGMTFAEVADQHQDELDAWLGSLEVAPGGGESFRQVEERVLAGLDRVLEAHAGRTVVVVSHVTPIKTLVAHALGAPLEAVYRMELTPASVTVLSFFGGGPDGTQPMASMRLYNARPGDLTAP